MRESLSVAGLRFLTTGLDPYRLPQRQLRHPRYDAMEQYFSRDGGADAELGPMMMTATAATQVNLDIGRDEADARARWRLLHTVGPTMSAMFANSPVGAGADTGWRSGRQRVWQGLDAARTHAPAGDDPISAWTDYTLDAPVMLRHRDGDDWSAQAGWTMRDWLDEADPPTEDDLELHLTTLFPPVRPRGWYEVRYLDAQPWRWWPVPVAVLGAVLDDPAAALPRRAGLRRPGRLGGHGARWAGGARACTRPPWPASTPPWTPFPASVRTPRWSPWSPSTATTTPARGAPRPSSPWRPA